jgi:Siroheme synthase (precorrin-2 oxidase/ferrochelatase domain)
MVTISTGGNSPALSRRLRLELENVFGKEYKIFTKLLGAVKKEIPYCLPRREKAYICQGCNVQDT